MVDVETAEQTSESSSVTVRRDASDAPFFVSAKVVGSGRIFADEKTILLAKVKKSPCSAQK